MGRNRVVAIGVGIILMTGLLRTESAAVAGPADNAMDILVVANKDVPVNSISVDLLRDLFLKVRKSWNNGANVLPINAKTETLRADFRKRALDMDSTAESRYWEDLKLKYGQSEPPTFIDGLKAVFKLKGSVSYVYRKDYKDGVAKVLLVLPAGK